MGKQNSYICVDLETTGLDPKKDKIIEIGAVYVENGVCKDTYETFLHPGRVLPDRITELTGITESDLQSAPTIKEILPSFLNFAKDHVLLGHSVLFDYSFLKRTCVNGGYEFERNGIDTLKIARTYLQDLESRRLDYLCDYYKIPHVAHRALADAIATAKLYEKMWERFKGFEGADTLFSPEPLVYKVKKEQPITLRQKERLYKLIELHKIEVDYEVDGLTRNEASRYTDQIVAKFGR